jgi:hypothetical protein
MSLAHLSGWDSLERQSASADARWAMIDAAVDTVVAEQATLIAFRRLSVALLPADVSGSLEDVFGDLLLNALEAAGGSEMTADDALDGLAEIDKRAAAMKPTKALATLSPLAMAAARVLA